jgi:hypothetical protein
MLRSYDPLDSVRTAFPPDSLGMSTGNSLLHQHLGRFKGRWKFAASQKVQWLILAHATSFAGPATQLKLTVIAHTEYSPRKAHPSRLHVQLPRQLSQIRRRPDSKLFAVNHPEFPSFTSAFMWQTSLFSMSPALCFHALINPFSSNSLLSHPLSKTGGVSQRRAPNRSVPSRRRTTSVFSVVCRLLISLWSFFPRPIVCFQWFATSFRKIPGAGYPTDHLRHT